MRSMPCSSECRTRGLKARRLAVSHAFHSSLVEPMLDEFEREAAEVPHGAARDPAHLERDRAAARRRDRLAALLAPARPGHRPFRRRRAALSTWAAACPRVRSASDARQPRLAVGRTTAALIGLPRFGGGRTTREQIANSLRAALHGRRGRRLVGSRSRDSRAASWRCRRIRSSGRGIGCPMRPLPARRSCVRAHPLLGAPLQSPALQATVFETVIDRARVPFLYDHQVLGRGDHARRGFLEMALAAGRASGMNGRRCRGRCGSVRGDAAAGGRVRRVQLIARSDGAATRRVRNRQPRRRAPDGDDAWTRHVSGRSPGGSRDRRRSRSTMRAAHCRRPCRARRSMRRWGRDCGSVRRSAGVREVWRGRAQAVGRVVLEAGSRRRERRDTRSTPRCSTPASRCWVRARRRCRRGGRLLADRRGPTAGSVAGSVASCGRTPQCCRPRVIRAPSRPRFASTRPTDRRRANWADCGCGAPAARRSGARRESIDDWMYEVQWEPLRRAVRRRGRVGARKSRRACAARRRLSRAPTSRRTATCCRSCSR